MYKIWEKISTSYYLICAYGSFSLGLILLCIGYGTTYWNDYSSSDLTFVKEYHLGLWLSCRSFGADIICQPYTVKGGIGAARTFETFAFLSFIAVVAVLFVYRWKGQSRYLLIASIGSAVTGVFIIVGALCWVFSTTFLQYNLSWSFAMCILGAVCSGITSALLLQERLKILAIKKRKISTAEAMIGSTDALDS